MNQLKPSKNNIQSRLNLLKNCSITYNSCRSLAVTINKQCKDNINQNCNNKCSSPINSNQTNNTINNKSNEIDCNWRPSNIDNGCKEFGGSFVNKKCSNGDAILGYYFDGTRCKMVSGFGVEGNFILFKSQVLFKRCLARAARPEASRREPREPRSAPSPCAHREPRRRPRDTSRGC